MAYGKRKPYSKANQMAERVQAAAEYRCRDVVHKSAQKYIKVGNGCGRRKHIVIWPRDRHKYKHKRMYKQDYTPT